jgi:CubicO group peptidase (beta-lactamase class C family)
MVKPYEVKAQKIKNIENHVKNKDVASIYSELSTAVSSFPQNKGNGQNPFSNNNRPWTELNIQSNNPNSPFITNNIVEIQNLVNEAVTSLFPGYPSAVAGGWATMCKNSVSYTVCKGVRNYTTGQPFTEDTILSVASVGKLIGTVGFLKLIERGRVALLDPLSLYIPEFANTKVLEKYVPVSSVELTDAFSTVNGSNVVVVTENGHGRNTGDYAGIADFLLANLSGIPESEINQIKIITVIDGNNYSFTTTTNATATANLTGGVFKVNSVQADVKQSIYLGTRYYKETNLIQNIKIQHVLNHTLGWGTYNRDVDLENIQIGIVQSLGLQAIDLLLDSGVTYDISYWATNMAQVPLLFQPGTDWSYGTQLSLLGAIIPLADKLGRNVQTFLKEELFDPLGMKDTCFFISPSDPLYSSKVSRTAVPYIYYTNIPVNFIPGWSRGVDWFYNPTYSQTICLIDAGIISTPLDLNLFSKALIDTYKNDKIFSNRSILSPNMVRCMTDNQIGKNSTENLFAGTVINISNENGVGTPLVMPRWGYGCGLVSGMHTVIAPMITSKRCTLWFGSFGAMAVQDFSNDVFFTAGCCSLAALLDSRYFAISTNSVGYCSLKSICSNDVNVVAEYPSTSVNPLYN